MTRFWQPDKYPGGAPFVPKEGPEGGPSGAILAAAADRRGICFQGQAGSLDP
jgi:hypothetical protein